MAQARSKVQVVVVGAGLAGITAALRLAAGGVEVAVLEARDRIGGRICGAENALGMRIDLGSQWIGPSMARMHRLIEENGLTKVDTYRKGRSIYDLAGVVKYGSGDSPPMSPMLYFDRQQFVFRVAAHLRRLDPAAPWRSRFGARLDRMSVGSYIERSAFTEWGRAYWGAVLSESLGFELSEVSLLDYLWELRSCGSVAHARNAEKLWILEGAHTLVSRLADRLSGRIHLLEPVRAITYAGYGALVDTGRRVWQADRVIVAVPPVLAGRIQYSPAISPRREQLMHSLRPGSVIKCVLVYRRPFWRELGLSGISYSDREPVKTTMDGSSPDRPEGVLIALVSGNDAMRLGRLTKEQRQQVVTASLARLYGSEALHPIAYDDRNWREEAWSLGGYGGHAAPGILTRYAHALHEPVGPIHWAGTETATTYRSYMEGAVQSGERAADEVLRGLGR